jgi:hypothetical protein
LEIVNADIAANAAIADTKLATISTAGKVSNNATTANSANTALAIVARDNNGNFSAGTITANLTGNASTVTTNANLTGDVTSVGNATAIAAGVIVNADINASAGIVDTKLATIATAGKVSNSATTATNANTASAIVARDASGNFSAGTITANLTGTASAIADNTVTSVKIVDGTIVDADINASAEIAVSKLADGSARQLLQTDSAGTGVEWTNNVDVPGTLDVTGATTLDSTLSVPLGTAALPSIYPGTDTNTGIYSPGPDQLAISTNGTGRLFVDASGSVGVGAAPGAYKLDVQGSGQRILNQGGGSSLKIGTGTTTNQFAFIDLVGDTTYSDYGLRVFRGNGGANTESQLAHRGTGNFSLLAEEAAPITFSTSNTERLRIASDGKVGVGTSSPNALLTVNGVGAFGAGSVSAPSVATTGDLDTGMYFPGANQLAFSTDGDQRLFIQNNGAVGIATNNPAYTLDVSGSARIGAPDTSSVGVELGTGATGDRVVFVDFVGDTTYADFGFRILRDGGANGATAFTHRGTGYFAFEAIEPAPITFATNDTERMRLDSTGRLGLGTSSPNELLEVTGNIHMSGTADRTIFNRANNALSLGTNNTARLHITNAGNVGIGTTSPTAALTFSTSTDSVASTPGKVRYYDDGTNIYGVGVGGGATLNYCVPSTANHVWYRGTSESARIDSSGRLLVGTSTSQGSGGSFQVGGSSSSGAATTAEINAFGFDGRLRLTRATTGSPITIVASENRLGRIAFDGYDGAAYQEAALIAGEVDGTPGADDMPGRLVFSVTADGAASPTEALRISSNRAITVSDGGNVVLGTTTGTKIGTATTQKLGFYNATPVVQPTAVADSVDTTDIVAQFNALLSRMRDLGLIAT